MASSFIGNVRIETATRDYYAIGKTNLKNNLANITQADISVSCTEYLL